MYWNLSNPFVASRLRRFHPSKKKIEARLATVPEEALNGLPEDASENLDHYLYDAPKK